MAKMKHLSHNNVLEKSMEKAKKYLAEENYVDAKDEIEKVLDANPMDDRALNLMAITMLKLEQHSKAVKIYEDLVTRYPNTMPLRINLGVAYLKNNQPDNAVKEFTAVLKKEPENKTVLKLYGKALLKLKKTEEALEVFTKAGMHDYVNKIKKNGPNETVMSELSTEDVMQEPIGKEGAADKKEGTHEYEQKAGSEQAANLQEPVSDSEGSVQEPVDEKQAEDDRSSSSAYADEEIIEAERGPSAIDEQELQDKEEETAEEPIKNESYIKQPEPEVQPPVSEEAAAPVHAEEPVKEEPAVQEHSQEEEKIEKGKQPPLEGLAPVSEETSLSNFTSPANLISDSMLLFNMDGNLVYVRNKGVVSIAEGLTIEQAYKRYRGKDTKSIFADKKDDPMVLVYGKGALLVKCDFKTLKLFKLKNEAMFLNDERLIAFQGDLEWENGRVELSADKSINVTQMRGTADLFLGISNRLLSLKVDIANIASIRLDSLVGWHGKLIPRPSTKQHYSDDTFISFHGEGVVFIDA